MPNAVALKPSLTGLVDWAKQRWFSPKPSKPPPLVRRKEDWRLWAINLVILLVITAIAIEYFGGASSGLYDAVTQTTYTVKQAWDSSISDGTRHLVRDGLLLGITALTYKVLAFDFYTYLYANYGWLDWVEIKLHFPNVQHTIQTGKRLHWLQKVAIGPLVVLYFCIAAYLTYRAYYLVRDVFPSLPPLTIPSAHPNAHESIGAKFASIVDTNWKVKLVFLPAVFFALRPARDVYHVFQDWMVKCKIGARIEQLRAQDRTLQDLSQSAPWYWTPQWRGRYHDLAGQVASFQMAAPAPMSRYAAATMAVIFTIVTQLSVFGHFWVATHT